jgi:hypothetical protein
MQNRLADYCFGNLNPEESIIFENSIALYDDLQKEVTQIKNAFADNLKEEFNDFMEYKSRNLSVKVNESLNRKHTYSFRLIKYLVPALGVLLFFAIIRQPEKKEHKDGMAQVISEQDINEMLTTVANPSDLLIVIDDNNDVSDIGIDGNSIDMDFDANEVYDEMVINEFFADIENGIDNFNGIQLTEDDMFSIFDELDNEVFEKLLKEFKNVKIIS